MWKSIIIDWKAPESWIPALSEWLHSFLIYPDTIHLKEIGVQDIYWDDSDWLSIIESVLRYDIEHVIELLANALSSATARTYHGCRTEDAGTYHRMGILRRNPSALANEVRRIVDEEDTLTHLRTIIEQRLRNLDPTDQDIGSLYVAIDDRAMIKWGGHYLLYGSEWSQSMLGTSAHQILRQRGVPTILTVDLPLQMVTGHERESLARTLLRVWTWVKVNQPEEMPKLDLSFCLQEDIPSILIVNHFHPEFIHDPFYENKIRRVTRRSCPSCYS